MTIVNELRAGRAFLVAPFAIPIVFFVVMLIQSFFPEERTVTNGSFLVGFLIYSIYGLLIGYICELVFGVIAWATFKHFDIRSVFAYAAAGAIMGLLFFAVTILAFSRFVSGSPSGFLNPYFLIDGASGMVSATLFWFVVFSGKRIDTA